MDSLITWGSRKQTTIALSSTEAEYVALLEASREAIWLRHLYGELGFVQREPILLLGDNDGSVAMAKNPEFHKRTKHVDIRWHWVRELVSDGLINVVSCRDPEQTADILTKQLPRPKFVRLQPYSICIIAEGQLYTYGCLNHITIYICIINSIIYSICLLFYSVVMMLYLDRKH